MIKRQSLAFGVPPSSPRTIHALALSSEASFPPRDDRTMLFGRNKPEVHVCVGERDPEVSRLHGRAVFHDARWWVANTGKRPIRLGSMRYLFPGDEEFPLPDGYTPLFVVGSVASERPLERREHLLEMYVTGSDGGQPPAKHAEVTRPPRTWRLDPDERLALLILSQQYLYYHFHPQPLSYRQTAEQLAGLQPAVKWTPKKVEWLVKAVRDRLSGAGVRGLTRDDVCGAQGLTKAEAAVPIGNVLNENLIRELMMSTTLVPRDLALLDE